MEQGYLRRDISSPVWSLPTPILKRGRPPKPAWCLAPSWVLKRMREQTWVWGEGQVRRKGRRNRHKFLKCPLASVMLRNQRPECVSLIYHLLVMWYRAAHSTSPSLSLPSVIWDIDQFREDIVRIKWNHLFEVFSLVPGTWSLVKVCRIIIVNHWSVTHSTSQIVADISICGLASLPRSGAWNAFTATAFCQTTIWILSLAVLLSLSSE